MQRDRDAREKSAAAADLVRREAEDVCPSRASVLFFYESREAQACLSFYICATDPVPPLHPDFFLKAERRKEAQLKAAMQQGMGLGHSGLGHAGLGHSALAHAGLSAGLGHPGLGGQHPVRARRWISVHRCVSGVGLVKTSCCFSQIFLINLLSLASHRSSSSSRRTRH